jgi:uncharacterized protein
MTLDYDELIKFAEQEIMKQKRSDKLGFTFRNRFIHTKRVVRWAQRIHEVEGGDWEVIHIACLLHDIGWEEKRNHAIVSKELADQYMSALNYNCDKKRKVLEAIGNHNMRENNDGLNIESYIVMDADILDEVGALSILWDAMAEGSKPTATYKSAYERIVSYSERTEERKNRLRTKTGRCFYEERVKFIKKYIEELEYELSII